MTRLPTGALKMARRIVYLSWPAKEISGGIKLAFRHAELLRDAGFEAVVASRGAEPPQWFETTAPLVDMSAVGGADDVLVFPENHLGMLRDFALRPNRKVVFCQNHYMAFRGLGEQRGYREFGVSAILAEGRQVVEFCRRRFPDLPCFPVPVTVDQRIFHFQHEKRLQVAFAPRKRPLEAAFVHDLFRAENPQWSTVPWVEISDVDEERVATILKQSAVYLALSRFESVSMSILEALASGCVVAGFTGFGAREYTTAKNGFWAGEDDCIDCVEQLTRAVRLVTVGGPTYSEMLEAANIAASYYSRERLARRLIGFWEAFLAGKVPAG